MLIKEIFDYLGEIEIFVLKIPQQILELKDLKSNY
jgi:hypothetical protein